MSLTRLQTLQIELKKLDLDGFLIPHTDEYQGEYIPPYARRLEWLTGFTGSAGLAIVNHSESAIFVDGRYTLAVQKQTKHFKPYNSKHCPPKKWLLKQPVSKIGYDPWLHTPAELKPLQRSAEIVGSQLIACENNPIDKIWQDKRPSPPAELIVAHSICYSGETSQSKRHHIAKDLANRKIFAAILTASDSIAWLLNIRGGDIPRVPVPLSFAILYATGTTDLFIIPREIDAELLEHLGTEININSLTDFGPALKKLTKQLILVDPKRTATWIVNQLNTIVEGTDPCVLSKACKNKTEIFGSKQAHILDGIAVTKFLHWLDTNDTDEIQAAQRLEQFRREDSKLHDLSFDTISATGSNAAIVHYQATEQSNKQLHSLYLVDSGGQYLHGTTDVTRTIAIDPPTAEQKQCFTLVLKGHINVATCRFPPGTTGSQLDILARHALWQAGLDYDHGTGHGVGSFLSVHEGPQNISTRPNKTALQPGMILSNEPGYYKEGSFGIRIENLLLVVEKGEQLGFETLTLVPIDLKLVNFDLLTEFEIDWLQKYHSKVLEVIGPKLNLTVRNWLQKTLRINQYLHRCS
ncbi:aminopeptidase P family protein [Candidatus Halobeggiatoa sp. HSG11]|nr:aminopeptidase P family protein [Candidatus Halobeggiatoa sp. HSG11]